MSASERSPLLSPENENGAATESSPLLADRSQRNSTSSDRNATEQHDSPPTSKSTKSKRGCRWPSIIAIVVLAVLVLVVIILGFLIPPAVKQYAENAVVLEPTSLSLEAITPDGVRARIQANFRLDGSRVSDNNARRLGRFATSIMRKLETKDTKVNVRLPHYENSLLGTAVVPPLTIDLVDGHNTALDFVADLTPGDADLMRKLVNEWLDGNIDKLKVTGSAAIHLKSGIFPLGTHDILESMVFEGSEVPSIPDYTIDRLNFHDVPIGIDGSKGIAANVSVSLYNKYPIALMVPPLGFEVLVPDCNPSEPYIIVASAISNAIAVAPEADVVAIGQGLVRDIPKSLTRACPQTKLSPLDHFMERYLHGDDAKVFVRGKKTNDSEVPDWAGSILESITVPIEFPGRSFDNLIRNLSLTDVDFKMPSPFARPDDPNSQPRISGTIEVLAELPTELNINIGVDGISAKGDVYYLGKKFGELNLDEWQKATSTRIVGSGDEEDLMSIKSTIVDAPLNITDGNIFSDLMQEMLFGDEDLVLDVKSLVNVKVATVLGNLVVRGVEAKGKIPVQQLPGDTIGAMEPHVGDLRIMNTSETGVHMLALVNLTNPTPYTAVVPYISIHVLKDGHLVGEAIARDVDFRLGNNTNIAVSSNWDPTKFGGEESREAGRQLLSDYLSGKNTTITLRAHRDSIPALPLIGEALSKINMTVPAPRIELPDDEEGEESNSFIREATFHIFSSTATFVLASPLHHNTIHLEHINATAFYNHTEPVGQIIHDEPFDATPGLSQSPKLPVQWSASHVGYDKLKDALGGSLKLDALAHVTFRVGNWVETIIYEGKGIGAKVSL